MGKQMQIHEFDPVIYPVKLSIIKNPTSNFIKDNFKQLDGGEINTHRTVGSYATTFNDVVENITSHKYTVLIRIFGKQTSPELAHEATHAARIIWDWLGEINTGVEADAYLVQWIVKCLDEVNKNKV